MLVLTPQNCCLTDHATSRLRWSDDDTKGKGRAGSVGCHDVTNTCSTKTVMQPATALGTGELPLVRLVSGFVQD